MLSAAILVFPLVLFGITQAGGPAESPEADPLKSAFSIMVVLLRPDVAPHLEVKDEVLKKWKSVTLDKLTPLLKRPASVAEGTRVSPGQIEGVMKACEQESRTLLETELPPELFRRVLGIFIQLHGVRSALNSYVRDEIGFDRPSFDRLMEEINSIKSTYRRRAASAPQAETTNQKNRRLIELAKEADVAINRAIRTALSADQFEKLRNLRGEAFGFGEPNAVRIARENAAQFDGESIDETTK